MRSLLLSVALCAVAVFCEEAPAVGSLPELCAKAETDHELLEKEPDLAKACELQLEIIQDQQMLEEAMTQPPEKRKNEFIRFGKRKNEFIRFGKRKNEFIRFGRSEGAADEHSHEKRKNEFIRFGKRKNEFIRFGKRKNEFIRFGRSAEPGMSPEVAPEKRKNEFIRFGKRKNEFIRFG